MDRQLKVGIGDMKLTRGQGEIITYALGSCIGIAFYDPVLKLGALLHIMLPIRQNKDDANLLKYADTGLAETIRKLTAFGMVKSRAIVKIAGGAKMFDVGTSNMINVGERNAIASREKLKKLGIPLIAEDCGKNFGRTVEIYSESGEFLIKAVGRDTYKI